MGAGEPAEVYSLLASDESAYGPVRKILARRKAFHQFRLPFIERKTIVAKGSVRKKGKKWYCRFFKTAALRKVIFHENQLH